MTEIAFYHLTLSSADEALPRLLDKTVESGKKAVVASDPKGVSKLSDALWSHGHNNDGRGRTTKQGSWLPHGVAGKDDEDAVLCPIWFSGDSGGNPNEAEFGFFLDGALPENIGEFVRVFVLFNGLDDSAVSMAREQWKGLRAGGHDLSYWTQDDLGKWQKTA